jgi:hypothetical protein
MAAEQQELVLTFLPFGNRAVLAVIPRKTGVTEVQRGITFSA